MKTSVRTSIAALLFLAVCSLLPVTGRAEANAAHRGRYPAWFTAKVIRVHDGDTITVKAGRRKERVRLIGVDTPEVEPNRKFRRDIRRDRRHTGRQLLDFGREARGFTKRFAPPGSTVGIELDVRERDRYGRILAYVWVWPGPGAGGQGPAKPVMLNALLLEEGMAQVMTVPPNVRHVNYFRWLQDKARREGRGFWGE